MSANSNLDKGLDEIIASNGISSGGRKQVRASQGFKKSRKGASTKTLGKAIEAAANAKANARSKQQKGKADNKSKAKSTLPAIPADLITNPLDAARHAVVSNLPLDVNEDAVRSYFSASVGKIRKVEASFRGDGTPSGTYTISFDRAGLARKLFEKFNNEPIDGGKKHLSVQILLNPTAIPGRQNTLQGRIGTPSTAAAPQKATPKSRKGAKRAGSAKEKGPLKAVSAVEPKKAAKNKGKNNAPAASSKKPQKKTRSVADLDAEMSDYFASADKNEISV